VQEDQKPITPAQEITPSPTPMVQRWTPGQLEIHILFVKHGDTQLIISPTGETMLIDVNTGYAEKTASFLRDVLGKAEVDYLLVTHYHEDHIGGIVPLLSEQGVKIRRAVLDRGGDSTEYTSSIYRTYYNYVNNPENHLTRFRLKVGDTIDMGAQLSISVLAAGDVDTNTNLGLPVIDDNDNSIALWLTFGKFDYWTGGDLTGVDSIRFTNIEAAVIPSIPRPVDVYRANHHSIGYNSSPEFVAALNPTVVLVSTSFEVVDWKTLLRLEKGSDVYITDQVPVHNASGDIRLTSQDGNTYFVEDKYYISK
jgi:competence protein ComEC